MTKCRCQFEEVEWFIDSKSSFFMTNSRKRNLQLHLYVLVSIKIKQNHVFFCRHKLYKKVLKKRNTVLCLFSTFIPEIWCWNLTSLILKQMSPYASLGMSDAKFNSSSLEVHVWAILGLTDCYCNLIVVPFNKKHQCLFVLAACETYYARGLKQMQFATEHSLTNQTVSISGLFRDLTWSDNRKLITEDRQCSLLHLHQTCSVKVLVSVWRNAWLLDRHTYTSFQV